MLAIGIVVDDAIVVVENVETSMGTARSPRSARRGHGRSPRGDGDCDRPHGGVRCRAAFISGITGQFFRQFALTIAVSTVISGFNSLTLSPALSGLILKPHGASHDPLTRLLNMVLARFFRGFNRIFDYTIKGYRGIVSGLLRCSIIMLLLYVGLLVLTGWSSCQPRRASFQPRQEAIAW